MDVLSPVVPVEPLSYRHIDKLSVSFRLIVCIRSDESEYVILVYYPRIASKRLDAVHSTLTST
jgi:hypothetical protein